MKNKPAQPESSLKENLEVAGFETCPNEKAFTSAPLCDVRSGEGWQRRGEVKAAFRRGVSFALGFIFTLGASAILAVAVSGTVNTFVNGSVMEASQLNTNFSTLKTAIEGITSSQWTSNGSSIYYNAGNVGIGTVSPGAKLDVRGYIYAYDSSATGNGLMYTGSDTAGIAVQTHGSTYGSTLYGVSRNNLAMVEGQASSAFVIGTSNSAPVILGSNRTEGVRITSSGNVGIGTTSPASLLSINSSGAGGTQVYVKGQGTTSGTFSIFATDSTATTVFYTRDDGVGYLKAASWTYGSDKKMKKNIRYLDKILKLRPAKFDYIQGSKNQIGFIAQDVQEVIPEAVEPINAGNGSDLLGLKSEFIVPYLVNAVKELKSLHDKETSDLSLQLKQASERLDTEKKKNDKLAEELASVRTQDRVSQRETQQIIEENSKLRERITKLETENKKLFTLEERLRAIETFQTAAAANANAGKERKQ